MLKVQKVSVIPSEDLEPGVLYYSYGPTLGPLEENARVACASDTGSQWVLPASLLVHTMETLQKIEEYEKKLNAEKQSAVEDAGTNSQIGIEKLAALLSSVGVDELIRLRAAGLL